MQDTLKASRDAAQSSLNASFLQLFPIVQRHHSPEIAAYRQYARHQLKPVCDAARSAGKRLKDHDPEAANTVSNIANYYESIGMLIEHGSKNLLPDVVNVLIDMVQESAYDIWELFHDYIDVIHPAELGTWAGSFEKLYYVIVEKGKFRNPKPPLPRTIPGCG